MNKLTNIILLIVILIIVGFNTYKVNEINKFIEFIKDTYNIKVKINP